MRDAKCRDADTWKGAGGTMCMQPTVISGVNSATHPYSAVYNVVLVTRYTRNYVILADRPFFKGYDSKIEFLMRTLDRSEPLFPIISVSSFSPKDCVHEVFFCLSPKRASRYAPGCWGHVRYITKSKDNILDRDSTS